MSAAQQIFHEEIVPAFEASRPEWLAQARSVALVLGLEGRIVTADDIRALCGAPPGDGRCMGAVFTRSDWVRVGYRLSNRRTCHGRAIAEFKRADRLPVERAA